MLGWEFRISNLWMSLQQQAKMNQEECIFMAGCLRSSAGECGSQEMLGGQHSFLKGWQWEAGTKVGTSLLTSAVSEFPEAEGLHLVPWDIGTNGLLDQSLWLFNSKMISVYLVCSASLQLLENQSHAVPPMPACACGMCSLCSNCLSQYPTPAPLARTTSLSSNTQALVK